MPTAITVTDSIRIRWSGPWQGPQVGWGVYRGETVLLCTEQGPQGTAWAPNPLFPVLLHPPEVQTAF